MKWTVLLLLLLVVPAKAQHLLDSIPRSSCPDPIPYTVTEMPSCEMTLLVKGPVVFTSEGQLRERFKLYASVCDTSLIPQIDFTKHTLIGRWITLGNCPAGKIFRVSVCRDEGARVYRHIVEIKHHWCRGISSHMSWILVPKLPEGYTVVFEGGRD